VARRSAGGVRCRDPCRFNPVELGEWREGGAVVFVLDWNQREKWERRRELGHRKCLDQCQKVACRVKNDRKPRTSQCRSFCEISQTRLHRVLRGQIRIRAVLAASCERRPWKVKVEFFSSTQSHYLDTLPMDTAVFLMNPGMTIESTASQTLSPLQSGPRDWHLWRQSLR
jgi:hypothetical protein